MGSSQSIHNVKPWEVPPPEIVEKLEQGAEIARTAQLLVSRDETGTANLVTKLTKVILNGKEYSEENQLAQNINKTVWLEPGEVAVSFAGSHIKHSKVWKCFNLVTDESEHIKLSPYWSNFAILTQSTAINCATFVSNNPDATLSRSDGIHHQAHPHGTFFLVFLNTSKQRAYLGEIFFNDYRGVANIKLPL